MTLYGHADGDSTSSPLVLHCSVTLFHNNSAPADNNQHSSYQYNCSNWDVIWSGIS